MPICITGMHRSGTSMVARLLHLCGLYLGPETDLIPATPDNPDGHWEHLRVVEINDEILNNLGGGWDNPPATPDNWEDDRIRHLRMKVEALRQEFLNHEPWGLKDPRICLTVPFWMSLFPELRMMICLRSPLEVALSLHRRSLSSYAFGLNLWKVYNQRLLESTHRDQRLITHYDSYFPDPEPELRRVSEFLDMRISESALERCRQVVKQDLRHYRFTTRHLLEAEVSPPVIELYLEMSQEARSARPVAAAAPLAGMASKPAANNATFQNDANGSQKHLTNGRDAAGFTGAPSIRLLNPSVVDLELLRLEIQKLRPELQFRESANRLLKGELESIRQERLALQAELKARDTAVERLQRDRGELEGIRQEHQALQAELKARDAMVECLQRKLTALRGRVEGVEQEREALTQALMKQTVQLADLQALMLDLREELKRRDERLQTALQSPSRVLTQQAGPLVNGKLAYRQLLCRIRGLVCTTLPRDAIVIVISKGDPELLELGGLKAWHFPQSADGVYAGHYPTNSRSAIAQLEVLKVKGGKYLLIPETAKWWFDTYPEFKKHLERRYRRLQSDEETGVIYSLGEPADSGATQHEMFERVIEEFQLRFESDPSILDWNSGLHLASKFPNHSIFSPLECAEKKETVPLNQGDAPFFFRGHGALPYLDRSIDIVAIASLDAMTVAEARRIARGVVVNCGRAGGQSGANLEVNWQLEGWSAPLPKTSIIIPVHNGLRFTEGCLATLTDTLPPDSNGEIIVVDDGSTDDTPNRLKEWERRDPRIRVLRQVNNSGFLASANYGASVAEGEILVFLNNDTVLLPDWLPPLLRTFRNYPNAGVVGGMLLFPEGNIQEAGGMVSRDGSAAHFGRGDYDLDDPRYNHVREIDYCSGALLATRKALFQELGGFDRQYEPGYYEDVDYCFRVRQKGFRVYFQPEGVIVHFEGATSGTDPARGMKHYQGVNQDKFRARWAVALKAQPERPALTDGSACHILAVHGQGKGVAKS